MKQHIDYYNLLHTRVTLRYRQRGAIRSVTGMVIFAKGMGKTWRVLIKKDNGNYVHLSSRDIIEDLPVTPDEFYDAIMEVK